MKHIFLIIGLVSVLTFPAGAKGRPTVISAEIYGYVRDQVYFDFLEKEGINMEFPYKEGQVIEFTVDLDLSLIHIFKMSFNRYAPTISRR